jgi:two-component system phosphate regulon response regulator PhoB
MTIQRKHDGGPRYNLSDEPSAIASAWNALLDDTSPSPVQASLPEVDVALVDDDPVIAAFVKRVLAREGYSAKWFEDGIPAVNALCRPSASLRANLILLDVSMPGLDGFGVLHYLRRDSVLDRSRVIMLTASVSEQDVREAVGLGATGYLAKPLDLHLLIARVRRSLPRPKWAGSSQPKVDWHPGSR